MARLHHEDIFSPIHFDTSLTDSINSEGSITNTSNIEREMCLSFKDAPYEKCVFEISDEKSVLKKNEMASSINSFKKTTKSEKSQVHRQDEIISMQGAHPGPVRTTGIVDDVFSPIRFDTSLADSTINSGGSITSTSNIETELCLSFKDVPYEKCVFEFSDEKSVERINEIRSSINSFENTAKCKILCTTFGTPPPKITKPSENEVDDHINSAKTSHIQKLIHLHLKVEKRPSMASNGSKFHDVNAKLEDPEVTGLSFTPKKDPSVNLVNSRKLASELKTLNIDKRTSKGGNVSVNKNIEIKENEKRFTNSGNDPYEINGEKNKKLARPKSLVSTKSKVVETNSSEDIKKEVNKIIRKSAFSKNANNQDAVHKEESNSSENKYLNRNISDVRRTVTVQQSNDSSAKSRITDNLEKEKSIKLQESKSTPNLLFQSENEVIEKMVHDLVSFECDKIRQNIYSHQMSFYRELNKIKDEMKQQHLETTERLFKMIEDLMHFHVLLKKKL